MNLATLEAQRDHLTALTAANVTIQVLQGNAQRERERLVRLEDEIVIATTREGISVEQRLLAVLGCIGQSRAERGAR